MDQQPDSTNPHQRMGGIMMFAMWLVLFLLLAYMFSHILDKQHNPNQHVNTHVNVDGIPEIELQRNRFGHYVTSGQINGQDVVFMLDTGATDVSIPEDIARDLGLERGYPAVYQTANGRITVYSTQLDDVTIGNIRLHNVKATINPNDTSDDILLGMSFLKHLEFTQRGDTLILRQIPNNS